MNRARNWLLALGACVLITPAAQAQYREQVATEIEEWEQVLAGDGYHMIDDSHTGTLRAGGTETLSLSLSRGRSYVVVGGCDADCGDLDLHLFDNSGNEVDVDIELDDYPMVVTQSGGQYRIRVTMVTCSTEPCYWGIGVFAEGDRDVSPTISDNVNGQTIFGQLSYNDATLREGEYYDTHTVRLQSGERLVADLRSSDFDPYLIVQPPTGDQSDNDDWQDSVEHSRVELTAQESGVYRILVTSYTSGQTGSYQLVISTGGGRSNRVGKRGF
ncbi:MAG: hypothetical protein O7I93_05270 [Gemmatimonadetes bacterium]|nr:hypothetical protein [Gemmatimonadota bacterium]